MSEQRQKIQLELAFQGVCEGEARTAPRRGTESLMAERATESPATERMMEEICEAGNLRKALQQVRENKGAPGVDGMTVKELVQYFGRHEALRKQLLEGTYRPQPVRRVEIPKPEGGGVRKLGIPCVLDRLVQQALLQVMQRSFDASFSEHSYGFRPGRSAKQAVARAQEIIASGRSYVVDLDLEKFFDRVNHDRLMAHLAKRIDDKRVLRLIRAFLNAGVMENGLFEASYEGTPQGGPLSPLLSNVVLDELDKELERREHQFVRYADDCNIYTASERAGQRVMASISTFITRRLKLKLNAEKSAVGRPWERKFLGFRISVPPAPLREIAPKAVARFKHQVRQITRRARGVSIDRVIKDLRPYLRGWSEYFGWCETPWMLSDLDKWVRRRLRCYLWVQWHTPRRRRARLRVLGVKPGLAAYISWSRGPWRTSGSKTLNFAIRNGYFDRLGLPRLHARRA
jgi:RNA-directed DNA polymerase